MKIIKCITIGILLLGIYGCAGWGWEYNVLEDEIVIEKVEDENDEAD